MKDIANMTDRELLEMAAKAALYSVRWYEDSLAYGPTFGIEVEPGNPCGFEPWNPLADDGDALRLAVNLNLEISVFIAHVTVFYPSGWCDELKGVDRYAATRRAIVRAAAEIGMGIA